MGKGKTKAGNVALATAGSYPKRSCDLFTDAHNGNLSSVTTMGFQADNPTDPVEIGKANPFIVNGAPICTVNAHVVRHLLHPDRQCKWLFAHSCFFLLQLSKI